MDLSCFSASTQINYVSYQIIIEELKKENQILKDKLNKIENKDFKYFLLASQEGEGCDYTIACGKDYQTLSDNLNDAKEETKEYISDNEGTDFEEVLILEVNRVIKKVFQKKEWEE